MRKVFYVAVREFLATVATKAFVLGVLVTPAMLGIVFFVVSKMEFDKPPKIDGEVAIVDPTDEVTESVRAYLAPEAIAERRGGLREKIDEKLDVVPGPAAAAAQSALDQTLGEIPTLSVVKISAGADLEGEKDLLRKGSMEDGGRLALVTVHPDAVERPEGQEAFGKYDLFIREKLDDRIIDEVKDGVREAIVDARVRAAGLDREVIDRVTRVGRVRSTTVTERGEQQTNQAFNMLLPMGFMILLLVSVFTGGQYLLTTTIEEKSSRVIEVVLAAVSPMQLMAGKIIGIMCVGLIIIGLYAGMGMTALASAAVLGLVDPWLFVYLIIFYLIAYFVVGSFMAAIGAAVNEPREAQSFMAPVMLVMMLPWMLWFWIVRDPNSTFATVTSFLPPINTFVMLLRVTSTTPPPTWQIWLSIGIGVASAYVALWFAAKIFRVGLLLHGKPPNFSTLIRWVRMA